MTDRDDADALRRALERCQRQYEAARDACKELRAQLGEAKALRDRLGACKCCGSLLDLGSSYRGLMRTADWCPACFPELPCGKIVVIDAATS